MEFLTKNADTALAEIKEKLYERLDILRTCLKGREQDDYGYIDPYDEAVNGEVNFLTNLLDIIERS